MELSCLGFSHYLFSRHIAIVSAYAIFIVLVPDFCIILIFLTFSRICYGRVKTEFRVKRIIRWRVVTSIFFFRFFFIEASWVCCCRCGLFCTWWLCCFSFSLQCCLFLLLLLILFEELFRYQKLYLLFMEAEIKKLNFLHFNIKVAQPLVNVSHIFLFNILKLVSVKIDVSVEYG